MSRGIYYIKRCSPLGCIFFLSIKKIFISLPSLTTYNIILTNIAMIKKQTDMVATIYESPKSEVVELNIESLLCASMQQLEEYEKEYEW